jgi:probable rRNA maturation factor
MARYDTQKRKRPGAQAATPAALDVELTLSEEVPLPPGIDAALFERVARAVLAAEGLTGRVELGLTIVDAEAMREINREQRGVDAPTDVLSFPLIDWTQPSPFVAPPDGVLHLGDIVLCAPVAVQQAEEYGHSVEREVAYLFAHGLLHLLGYDHEDPAQQAEMRRREEAALAAAGVPPRPSG